MHIILIFFSWVGLYYRFNKKEGMQGAEVGPKQDATHDYTSLAANVFPKECVAPTCVLERTRLVSLKITRLVGRMTWR